ncbi:phosphate ABC transporter permease PstA [Aneurinibacillus aneurinilyticus]|jgi:phosphate transport system permease protein|uniref:Phosphate transport system permease protein PstA n=2 Tax=Aneurinibacillus aneurinilyticus TaxID=1391 RepID=U1YFX0_ANEAE|nr:phosphate ABC transporter permease PstA [Aneurinibacillus aneurinilyticus]ERI10982.1 phosphate ABC transporter, permease protein PstA [Aneurinibacillus aneurinilyticus ATCC 12856]MCI1695615.1 phosphate ABC transporter permease PstA [Aneurinibacillus aneurinilyticus]MED0673086.1 phosphate ABC transporter permease PstA [Aneurinibacillus aneurinilyticus]MED0705980.1 phosphate ABC transporter permease PstA [Aneurinibacillus aneurinilyticus]MED0721341.1 phosphate ABC transporter permease PstA [A
MESVLESVKKQKTNKLNAKLGRRRAFSSFMVSLTILSMLLALTPLFSILGYVLVKGIPALNFAFFTELPAPPGEAGGGMANGIVGTFTLIGLASLIGVPVGLMAGVFLSEYGRNRFGKFVSFLTDIMLGVPSIVVGIVVYALVVLWLGGFSAYAGGIALAFIMIPAVTRTTEEMLKLVPNHIREAGLALGIPKWRVIMLIILPTALRGIITGIMLAVARVSGETAPLLFTAFGNMYWNKSLNEPIASMPVLVFNYAISPYAEWQAQAWAGALTLILIVLVLNVSARLVTRKR